MKQKKILLLVSLVVFMTTFSSCEFNKDSSVKSKTDLDLSKLDLSGLQMDFTRVIDLNKYSLEDIAKELQATLKEVDYEKMAQRMGLAENMEAYLEINLLVNEKKQTATFIATEQSREKPKPNNRVLQTDDEKCGGENGDGWSVLDNCFSPDCVAEAILAGADQLGEPGNGECLDFRVVGLLVGVRVCGRKIEC
ncbi:hypothetical protein [uncultured Algoriphagus sp.]|uniref:hypothetical protein n=1 Tax=uncultured Algoriphagus sp. TaxID=417365 RepID=UPI002585B7F4|nr:hypothetical protein [uncultured Algoriphagus sp.]